MDRDLLEETEREARAAHLRWQRAKRRLGELAARPRIKATTLERAARSCARAERGYRRRERAYLRALEARRSSGAWDAD